MWGRVGNAHLSKLVDESHCVGRVLITYISLEYVFASVNMLYRFQCNSKYVFWQFLSTILTLVIFTSTKEPKPLQRDDTRSAKLLRNAQALLCISLFVLGLHLSCIARERYKQLSLHSGVEYCDLQPTCVWLDKVFQSAS